MSVINPSCFHLTHTLLLCVTLQTAMPLWAKPLTLTDAQRYALAHSRQLIAQDASITASLEMAVAAIQRPDPILKIGIDNMPIDGTDRFSLSNDFMTMRRIGVMQEMPHIKKRQLQRERFEREAEKLHTNKDATIASIERETALAWLNRYYAEHTLAIISKQLQQAQFEINAAQSTYRAGNGHQTDVLAAQSVLIILENQASQTRQQIQSAKDILVRWIGDTGIDPLANPPDIDQINLQLGTLESHIKNHPEIVALTKQAEIAITETQLAKANKHSDWSWEIAFQQRRPTYSNMVSIGLSFPLQWDQKNRQDREIAAKQALVEAAHHERDEMIRTHLTEVRTMISEWENTRERRTHYQKNLLSLAQDQSQAVLAAYRGGKSSLNEVLAAQRTEIDIHLQIVQLNWEIAKLWAKINFIIPDLTLTSPIDTQLTTPGEAQ